MGLKTLTFLRLLGDIIAIFLIVGLLFRGMGLGYYRSTSPYLTVVSSLCS